MKIQFVTVGKSKDGPAKEWAAHYLSAIARFCPVEHVPLKIGSNENEQQAQSKAFMAYLDGLKGRSRVSLLDERGKTFKSQDFAAHLQKIQNQGFQNWVVAAAGGYGFSSEVTERVTAMGGELWSLSPMIMAHDLAQVVALEQIYRAFCILSNHPYHHA